MISLVLAVFAVYRVARLLALEEAPFAAATWLRNRWLADDWIGRGIRCPLCIGFWLALIAGIAVAPTWADVPLYWLGIAGAQTAVHHIGER